MDRSRTVAAVAALIALIVLIAFFALPSLFGVLAQPEPAAPTEGVTAPRAAAFRAAAPGRNEIEAAIREAEAEAAAAPDPRCVIEGSVSDGDGEAVSAARVTARPRGQGWGSADDVRATESDAEGRFRIEALSCATHRLTATAGALSTAVPVTVALTGTETEATVALVVTAAGHRIWGTLSDRSGGSLPGATMRAVQITGGAAYETLTGDDGRYALRLPAGDYVVQARAPDYAPELRRVAVNRDREVSFVLDPAGAIRGRVLLRGSEQAVAGATVTTTDGRRWWDGPQRTLSDAAGAFELAPLGPGEYELQARLGHLRGRSARPVPVRVAGYVSDVVIYVEGGLSIMGTVRDPGGTPVTGARIRWRVFRGEDAEAYSRADGSFLLTGLGAGRGRLTAEHERYAPASVELGLEGKDIEGVELVLRAGAVVRGVVVASGGAPVAGAMVLATPEGGSGFRPLGDGAAQDVSDDRGRFILGPLAGGDLAVSARHLEAGFARITVEGLEPGKEREVRLEMERGASITGTVVWEDGGVPLGATVHASSRELGPLGAVETEVDEGGAYVLRGLEPRTYTVWVLRPGAEIQVPFPPQHAPRREVDLADGDVEGVNFALERPDQEIRGTVVDAAGSPVPDAEVGASSETSTPRERPAPGPWGGTVSRTRSDAEGAFIVGGLTRGTYTLWAELAGFPRASIDAVEAGAAGVVITIPPGAVLAGIVLATGGGPAPSYDIRAAPFGEGAGWSRWRDSARVTVDDPSGAFELVGLPAGTYRLVASTPSGQIGEVPQVEVAAGERRAGLRILLGGGATLSGNVIGHPSGAPVPALELFLATDGPRRAITAGEDGTFRADGVPPGPAVLVARPDAQRWVPDRFELRLDEGDNTIEVHLVEVASLAPGNAEPPLWVDGRGGRMTITVADSGTDAPLATGDELVAVDGVALAGLGVNGVGALLRGPKGSTTTLSLISAESGQAYSASVTRTDAPEGASRP